MCVLFLLRMFSPEEKPPKNMDLSILGSSIPIYSPQPKTSREYKTNRPPQVRTRKKEFSFPVEKIVYLTERLELTSLTETKSLSVQRNRTTTTPPFDFSIDLSSISNDEDDSDEDDEDNSCRSPNEAPQLESFDSPDKPKPRTGDLINVYINSSNNQDIVKYFRPCRSCEELCCVCPATSRVSREGHREPHCCCQIDYVPPCCGCCLSDDSIPSSRSGAVSYTSSLANAARSARVLARDLEVILSTLNTGN